MQSSSSSEEASEQATGIIMVSVPESSDDYQTPPEHQFSSQNSSNDGQVPAAKTKTASLDGEVESSGVQAEQRMVVEDTYDRKKKQTIDITNDSDNLEFLENRSRTLEYKDNNILIVDVNDTGQIEAEESNAAKNWVVEDAPKVFVEMPMREQEVSMSYTEVNKSLNKIDDHNVYPKGKGRLPFSISIETEKKNDVFIDTLNRACKILKREAKVEAGGDTDKDDDFLETAMRRGLIFHRPRWWPPEGCLQD
ncbi:hypothetical protein Lser_V15G29592 [Lactuca serriola]